MFNKIQLKVLNLILKAKELKFDINSIKKNNKNKEIEKQKILKIAHKNLNDSECVEVLLLLVKKNILLRMTIIFLLNYYIKEVSNANNNIIYSKNDEIL